MSAVINPEAYQNLANTYASLMNSLVARDVALYEAVLKVCDIHTGDGEVKIDLLKDFVNVYTENIRQNESSLLPAVRRLNNHVTQRNKFPSLDSYLRINNVQVPQEWADLCAASGVTIAEDLIS